MRAIVAVAASVLTAVFHILRDGVGFRDLGSHHFDSLDRAKATQRLVRRLAELGYTVELKVA